MAVEQRASVRRIEESTETNALNLGAEIAGIRSALTAGWTAHAVFVCYYFTVHKTCDTALVKSICYMRGACLPNQQHPDTSVRTLQYAAQDTGATHSSTMSCPHMLAGRSKGELYHVHCLAAVTKQPEPFLTCSHRQNSCKALSKA